MSGSGKQQGHLVALDSLRGICATIVVVHHLNVVSHLYGTTIQRNGWMFVDFFFVLSGFVIYHSYGHRLTDWRACVPFVVKRIGRVWPLHVLILALLVAAEAAKAVSGYGQAAGHGAFGPQMAPGDIVPNLLLIQAIGFDHTSWNQPAWSISVEFWTYLIFAALSVVSGRRLIPIAVGLTVACALLIAFAFDRHLEVASDYGIVRCLYGFMLGTCVAFAFRSGRLHRFSGTAAEIFATALAFAVLFVGDGPWSVMVTPIFALVVAVFAGERGMLSRGLRARPIERLGLWSYSIYMIHVPLILLGVNRVLLILARETGGGSVETTLSNGEPVTAVKFASIWMGDLAVLAFVALVLCLAAVSYRLIEDPFRTVFARLARGVAKSGSRAMTGARAKE